MKVSFDATAALLSVALYSMMMPHAQATDIVRSHRDMLSSLPYHRHLDDGACFNEALAIGSCFTDNEECVSIYNILIDGDGRNRRLEDTIISCEDYESQVCTFDTIFSECPCFDEYKAQLKCQTEQAGLTCELSPDCNNPRNACAVKTVELGLCFLENEGCTSVDNLFSDGDGGSGRNRRLEDTIISCEDYESQVCTFDTIYSIYPECPCFDEYKAQLECQTEQAGLTCESSPNCDDSCAAISVEAYVCSLEDENCSGAFDDDGDSSGLEDGAGEDDDAAFASCEEYYETLSRVATDFPGCECIDQLKAAADCAAKQDGLTCDSITPPTMAPITPAPIDNSPPPPTMAPITSAPVDDSPLPTPSAGTSPQNNVLLISFMSILMAAVVPFGTFFV